MEKKIVALIPARGGSKSIPYKNIKIIGRKPLIYWTCKAAAESKYVDDIYVSTDDEKIKSVVESFKLNIKIINRPYEYATDQASTESVLLHFAQNVKFDIVLTMQPTSPLTTRKDLESAVNKFIMHNNDSLFSGVHIKNFIWDKNLNPLTYDYKKRVRRQDFGGSIIENGAFYITKKNILEKYKNRLGGEIGTFLMPKETLFELDELGDWSLVEKLLSFQNRNN